MKKIKFLSALCALPLILGGAELVKVAPEDILFLAHFDHSTDLDKGNMENAELVKGKLTSDNAGFPFAGKGKQEALDLSTYGKQYFFPAENNFSIDAGTIQFWVLPKWKTSSYAHCVFFHLVRNMEGKNKFYFNWKELHVQKRPKTTNITAGAGAPPKTFAVGEISTCGKGAWMQIALTWNKKQNFAKLYINGKFIGEGKLGGKHATQPQGIVLGGPKSHNAQAYIDEVRILKRVLTDDEIKQDYEANLAGIPFDLPAPGSVPAVGYTPVKTEVVSAANTSSVDVKDFNFEAGFVPADFKVDGDLSKAVWQNVPAVPELRNSGKKVMKNRTVIKLLYSPTALYVSGSCYQDMANLVARWDQDDQALWQDDDVEFFIDVPGRGFHQICVNALGSVTDLRDGTRKWNINGRQAAAKRFDDRWDFEIKIPFAALGMNRPFAGDFGPGMRFYRVVRHKFDSGSVPHLPSAGNNRRYRLAALKFLASGSSSVAVTASLKEFFPGVNPLEITLENTGKAAFDGTVKLLLQDRLGQLALLDEKSGVKLAPGAKTAIKFSASVPGMDSVKLIATVADKTGEIGSVSIPAGFPMVPGGFSEAVKKVRRERGTLAVLMDSGHPSLREAVAAVQKITPIVDEYEAACARAFKEKTFVSKELCTKVADNLHGFALFAAANPYMIWQTSPWATGTPDELPPAGFKNLSSLKIQLAGNEREAVCFIVSGLFCNGRMDLRVVPKVKRTKQGISTKNFEIYVEKFLNHSGDIISAPLIPALDNSIVVTPGAAVRVWVVFNSRGVDAGDYNAEILLKSAYDNSIPTRSIPMSVKIWNFTLPETHEWPLQSFLWGPNFNIYDEVALLKKSHEYHITHGWSKSFNYVTGWGRDGYRNKLPKGVKYDKNISLTANEEFFKTALKLKMKFVIGWNNPIDAEWYRMMGQRFLDMGFKPGEFVFKALIRDEFVKAHIPAWAPVRDEVSKFKKDWHFQAVYLSAPPPTGATMDDIENAKLPEFYKMWTVIRGLLKDGERGQDVIRRLKAKGCQVWSYSCARYMQVQDVLNYYRLYPWDCYQMGLDGVAWWTVMSVKEDPFDHRDGYDDGVALAWHDSVPVTTKRFEAIREGLEDVAYMDRLKKELARCKAKNLSFPEYEKLLEESKEIVKNPNQKKVDSWRDRCGAAIHDLIAK